MALNNLGAEYLFLGEYDRALETLQEGLQVIRRIPENRAESYLLWTMGDLQRERGALNEAEVFYQRCLQITDNKEPFLRATIFINLATLRRWEGKLDEAQ
jgi:tetratricopeptide (TPR) repeat protein